MPIPNTLSRKITADFRAEKKYGGRKKFCDALPGAMQYCSRPDWHSHRMRHSTVFAAADSLN